MSNIKTVEVPHLGGITAGYQTAGPIDPSKPTLVLVNSFATNSELYRDVFNDEQLTSAMNLVAIELLGHGQTRAHKSAHWTYWDTAIMNLQVMEKLGVEKAFVLGTSQGGWVTVRMALLAPEKVLGILPLGSSMDYESDRSRKLGCWESFEALDATITGFSIPNSEFVPGDDFAGFLIDSGFGTDCPAETRQYWKSETAKNYQGDEGRKRLRMAAINLRDRDGLYSRLSDVVCPVLWLHGTNDAVYSVANAKEEIQLFKNSPDARLEIVEGGQHFLSASNPKEVAEYVLKFVKQHSQQGVRDGVEKPSL